MIFGDTLTTSKLVFEHKLTASNLEFAIEMFRRLTAKEKFRESAASGTVPQKYKRMEYCKFSQKYCKLVKYVAEENPLT